MLVKVNDNLKAELKTQCDRYRNFATDFMTQAMTGEAKFAWEYYYGTLPKPVTAGGSKWVDRTVMETVNGTLQDLMNVFTAGEDAVSFASVDERDSDAAKVATQTVNQILLRDNNGYGVLQSALKECLVTRNSFIKRYWGKDTVSKTEQVEGVHPEELQSYIQGLEDSGVREIEVIGEENDQGLIDATIHYVMDIERVKVEYVPLEEIFVDQWATSIQNATYFAHRTRVNRQKLLELGFPEDEINSIQYDSSAEITQTEVVTWARSDWRNDYHQDIGTRQDDLAMNVWLYEQYIRTSILSDDNTVRLYQVMDAGDRILSIEEVDDIPFETFTPYPIPGMIWGESIYDITKDIQDLRTAIIRGIIDNVNNANYGRYTAIVGAYDRRSLLDNRPGGVVEMERPDAVNLLPYHGLPQGIDGILSMTDEVKELRTGVTKLGMGINADVFKNDNAYATVGLMMNAAQNRIRMVARNIATNGMINLMRAIYRLFRENSKRPLTVQTSAGLIQVSPKDMPPRDQMIVSVAISSQEKQQRAQNLMLLKQMIQTDPQAQPLFTLQEDRFLMSEVFTLMGIKDVHNYLKPLDQVQPPQPDPMQQAMAQAQVELAKSQVLLTQNQANKLMADATNDQHRLAFEQQKAADQMHLDTAKLQGDQEHAADNMTLENRKADNQARLDQAKHNLELMKQQVHQYEAALKEFQINVDAQIRTHEHAHTVMKDTVAAEIQRESLKASSINTAKQQQKAAK